MRDVDAAYGAEHRQRPSSACLEPAASVRSAVRVPRRRTPRSSPGLWPEVLEGPRVLPPTCRRQVMLARRKECGPRPAKPLPSAWAAWWRVSRTSTFRARFRCRRLWGGHASVLQMLTKSLMSAQEPLQFDPWGPVGSLLSDHHNADLTASVLAKAGLILPRPTGKAAYSHRARTGFNSQSPERCTRRCPSQTGAVFSLTWSPT